MAQIPDDLIAAADKGVPSAQYAIGKLYERGEGVEADDFAALRWFQRAADGGHADAALDLGWMLANGYGAARDAAEAYYWFTIAMSRGVEGAAIQRRAVHDELDDEARAYLDRKAEGTLGTRIAEEPKIATHVETVDDTEAIENAAELRRLFWTTWGPDYLKRLTRLAEKEDPIAQNLLGLALVRGTDAKRQENGLEWLFRAAKSGLVAAQYNLADAYMNERIGIMNPDVAARWLKEARRGLAPSGEADDYETVTRLFKEAKEYRDRYRAATLGYESARDALSQLVEARHTEALALMEMNRRLGR